MISSDLSPDSGRRYPLVASMLSTEGLNRPPRPNIAKRPPVRPLAPYLVVILWFSGPAGVFRKAPAAQTEAGRSLGGLCISGPEHLVLRPALPRPYLSFILELLPMGVNRGFLSKPLRRGTSLTPFPGQGSQGATGRLYAGWSEALGLAAGLLGGSW